MQKKAASIKGVSCLCNGGNGEETVPLGTLKGGEQAQVVGFALKGQSCSPGSSACHLRIEGLGIRAGKTLEMINNGGWGPVLCKVGDTRIALGRNLSMNIMVMRTV